MMVIGSDNWLSKTYYRAYREKSVEKLNKFIFLPLVKVWYPPKRALIAPSKVEQFLLTNNFTAELPVTKNFLLPVTAGCTDSGSTAANWSESALISV